MPTKKEIREFSEKIEFKVKSQGFNWMEAILDECTQRGMEIELGVKLISPTLKEQLKEEAGRLNMLKKK